MAIRYTRVRDKHTGHEYDQLTQNVDPKHHIVLDRYPETSRPRPAKPLLSKDGGRATPGDRPGALSARSSRPELEASALELGIDPAEFDTKTKLFDAITTAQNGTD